jgi:alanine dehydrogenase
MKSFVLDSDTIESLVNPQEIVESIKKGFIEFGRGSVTNPTRLSFALETDWWGVMPAYHREAGFCVKTVCVIPGNSRRNLATTRGVVLAFDGSDGSLRAVMDGTKFTAIRTAAVTAAALKCIGEPRELFFIGAGLQARNHAKLLSQIFGLNRVNALSRNKETTESFLAYCRKVGLNVDPKMRVSEADTVVAATSSTQPVIQDFAGENRIIVSIGAPVPTSREVGDDVIKNSDVVVVDSISGCLAEAGDLVQTIKTNVLDVGKMVELSRVLTDTASLQGKRVFFKSVGAAFQDLFAADYLVRKASETKLEKVIELEKQIL